ncbi:major histocompatibility complex class I-related gene protein-like [Megalops cyprinoides]|uniref:major histocompatibility complex class I-related gene protein-like n=1 Tax=Megalops cyprinoides TaxID=118141 RepID=UPI001864D25E|nr:major histocompatibility complex class I-related gene protein-like [Megalops cyprinoides]
MKVIGSHSLWVLATFIHGQTEFPEFSAVLMVDDVQLQYYDNRLHVYQKMAGCELNDGKPSPAISWDAYDGTEVLKYNVLNYTYNPLWPELIWSKLKLETIRTIYMDKYQPICIKRLRQHLKEEENILMRKECPRVRLIQKTDKDTGGVTLSCLATGFYPRHINLTMLRDGQPITEQELTVGEVLPNGDGTYQLRRSLSVSEEELREKHHYTCTVTHLSLGNKLDVSWVQ